MGQIVKMRQHTVPGRFDPAIFFAPGVVGKRVQKKYLLITGQGTIVREVNVLFFEASERVVDRTSKSTLGLLLVCCKERPGSFARPHSF
jgi:hypothetical protein